MNAFGPRLRAALLAGRRANVRGYGIVAPRRGDGYEFAELRAYMDGDDPRRIDWAATARAGALQTRVMLEDATLVLAAVVDGSASMHVGRTTSNYDAGCTAARMWYDAAIDDDRCARIGFGAHMFPAVRGRAAAAACAAIRDPIGTVPGDALHLALAALPRGARLLLISDFYDLTNLGDELRACANRFDLTALLAADPWRAGLPLRGFVRLRDAESSRVERLYVGAAARARYRAAVAAREKMVLTALRDVGARTAVLDAAAPEAAFAAAFGLG
ncbi:MAG: DUF58 domain-containing protein [Candidatus Eremiobacteraeota bacterium]|nr:DUF58 domain-containing protein [Candidatus Eremiobacteraeota bacterium]MBC5804024.1 DUF58 domain-containing protein [Candidatus Eremiobacteraeota bacterium]MBC5820423.1 DUF58 domain-containing protein [Candidatus Eremiobacteraeota bacterium]